jgi:hypothetical protein
MMEDGAGAQRGGGASLQEQQHTAAEKGAPWGARRIVVRRAPNPKPVTQAALVFAGSEALGRR